MGMEGLTGAEAGSLSAIRGSGGTVSVDATTKRTGAYSFKCAPVTTGTGYIFLAGWSTSTGLGTGDFASGATRYLTFYVKFDTLPSADEMICRADSASNLNEAQLRITSSGNIKLYDQNSTNLLYTSTAALSTGTWYRIELKVEISNTGAYTLNIYPDDADGSTPETTSGTADFKQGAGTFVSKFALGKVADTNGSGYVAYFDDIAIADDAFYPGKCELMIPNADGTYTDFSGSGDYTELDEVPADTTDFLISSLVADQAQTAALESAATAGISGTVNAVLALTYTSRPTAGNTFRLRYRSTSDVDSADWTTGSPQYHGVLSTTKPGGGAWDTTALDGLEIGIVERDTAQITRLQAVHAEVHFTEAAAATTYPWRLTLLGVG